MLSEAKHLVHQPSQPAAPEMRGPGHAPVMLSEAKHLDGLQFRSFAALRTTDPGRAPVMPSEAKPLDRQQFRSFAALRTTGHKDLLRPSWHVAPGGSTILGAGGPQP